jgi:hypothetical protein
LSFSYWIDYLGFITEGKLAAIFIKHSLGVSNWPIILLHQQTQSSFLASSSPHHQAAPESFIEPAMLDWPVASFSSVAAAPEFGGGI